MNNVSLVGRLTRDPEVSEIGNDKIKKARFTLAVDRPHTKDKTDFISCIAWRSSANFIGDWIKKGNQVAIVGRIETGSYEKDGNTVYTTDVIVDKVTGLGSKSDSQSTPASKPAAPAPAEAKTENVPWEGMDL